MPLYQSTFYPDLSRALFYDDFIGASYNSRLWAFTTSGGSVTALNSIGGVVLIRANKPNKYCYLNHGNVGAYSVANSAVAYWRGFMLPGAAAGARTDCGLQSAASPTTEYICWRYEPNVSANFRCVCATAAGTTNTDSTVVADTNGHIFGIECATGSIKFLLDGILKATVTTNITVDALQPFVYCNSSGGTLSDFQADWVDARGIRT